MKKLLILFLCVLLAMQGISAIAAPDAEVEEFLTNGDFESLTEKGAFKTWGSLKAAYMQKGGNGSGEYCLELACTEETGGNIYATQKMNNFDDKNEYELTFDYKSSDGGKPHLKLVFRNEDGETLQELTVSNEFASGSANEWQSYAYTIEPLETTFSIEMYVRGRAVGTSHWYDNMSVLGVARPEKPYEAKAAAPGAGEMYLNGSFENGDAEFTPYQNTWSEMVSITSEEKKSGDKSLKISTEGSGLPWARQEISGVTGNTEYQLLYWYNAKDIGGNGIAFKFEFYDKDKKGISATDVVTPFMGNTKGKWKNTGMVITSPKNTAYIQLYARLYGTGTVYFDDISFYRTSEIPYFSMETDWTFFYPERTEGVLTFFPALNDHEGLSEGTYKVDILDGEKVLETSGEQPISGQEKINYTFSAANFTVVGKPYTARLTVTGKDGQSESGEILLYRYERPTMMNPDGTLKLGGKDVIAMMGYHVYNEDMMKVAAKAGVNVVQAMGSNVEQITAYLDACQRTGIYGIVVLYGNMLPAGHEKNMDNTMKVVNGVKDHPALAGWLIADEPYLYMADAYDALVASYKAIRDIDPKHPTFIQCDDSGKKWRECAECCDVLIVHNYPITRGSVGKCDIISEVDKTVGNTRKYIDDDSFPVWFLGQSFGEDRAKSEVMEGYVLPTVEEYRKILYASAFLGVQGLGTYSFEETYWKITDEYSRPLLSGMEDFAEKDLPHIKKAFISGEYTLFNEGEDENALWRTYTDGKDLYLFAINAKAGEKAEATISLKSANELTGGGDFTAYLINGKSENKLTGTDAITLSMEADDVLVYRISVSGGIDTEKASIVFTDIDGYDWAKEAILSLWKEKIVNKKGAAEYAPGTPITRGDFAMFFIRTLGLSVTTNENFDDVDENAEYAEYVAIGKALGILNGVGDNKYNPEAEISRQDLMTIISRGMELAGEGDVSAFSDSGLIADYALPHVKAMIAAGLIAGNADGTINPLGNTTRAEAAVIMRRILDK